MLYILNVISEYLVRLINLIALKQCTVCGKRLSIGEEVICYKCNSHLPRTYFSKNPYENIMAKMFWGQIPTEKAVAFFYYEPRSEVSRIIHSMKYFGHPENCENMGRLFAAEIMSDGFFNDVDAIVPMPLTRKRQWHRGYKQSYEMARGVSEVTNIPVLSDVVARIRFGISQTKMSRPQRIENVEFAFKLKKADKVKGKHILIIDDVVTTGASVISCAKELSKAGDVKFSIFSLGLTRG